MIEERLDDCFEVSLKRQGRDVGHRNSVVAKLIGPLPNRTVVGIVLVVETNLGGISKVWGQVLKSNGFSIN